MIEYNSEEPWWEMEEEEMPKGIFEEADRIDTETLERQQAILDSHALYGDMGAWPGGSGISRMLPTNRRISHNVIATAVDALVAEVTQSIPRPMAITRGGSFRDRRRARKLTSYWDSKFDEKNVYDLGRQCVRDCVLSGLGILRSYRVNPDDPSNDSVEVERIFPSHFLIDDRSCVDVKPRECYIRRFIDRRYLVTLYPDSEREIMMSRSPTQSYWVSSSYRQEIVEVFESWHLPDGGGKGGLHVICTSDALLFKEDHDRDRFPLCFVRPAAPSQGFWGPNLVQRGAPAQYELNKLLRRIQESMHLHAVPRVFLNRQAGVVKSHLQNDIGVVVEYEGQPPIFLSPASMGADVYMHLERLEQWIYKEMGISELSAVSKKPQGLDSGAALRTFNDVQSRRWINLQRSYERMHEDLARELTHHEQAIAKAKGGTHNVSHKSGKYVHESMWNEIYLDDDRYLTRVYSSGALPNTPAGKLQFLSEMVKMGIIDDKKFVQLADIPDFEAIRDLVVAPQELLEERFENMLDGGDYIPPEPYLDLVQGRLICTLMIQRAELEGADDEDLDSLRDWISDSIDLERRMATYAQRDLVSEQQAEMAMQPPAEEQPMDMALPAGAQPAAGAVAGGLPEQMAIPSQQPVTQPYTDAAPIEA